MQYFPPFGSNPLVPTYFSLTTIDLFTDGIVDFVFSTAFPTLTDIDFPLSGVVVFTNSDTISDATINLPDATLGAVGNQSLFLNNTSIDLSIKNFGGTQVANIAAGTSRVIILQSNSDTSGEWITVSSGTVSPVDPTILAGGGLVAFGNKLNVVTNVTDYPTLPSSFTVGDDNSLFNYTGSTASWMLPVTPYNGFSFYLKNNTTVNGILTITPQAGKTIDGTTHITLQAEESVFLISQNQNWFSFGRISVDTTGVQITSAGIRVTDGSAATPSYSFINFPNVGLYTQGTSDISVTTNGNLTAAFSPQSFNSEQPIQLNGINILYLADIYP